MLSLKWQFETHQVHFVCGYIDPLQYSCDVAQLPGNSSSRVSDLDLVCVPSVGTALSTVLLTY